MGQEVTSLLRFRVHNDLAHIRLVIRLDTITLARHPGSALTPELVVCPRKVGMVFANPANAETIRAVSLCHSERAL
jgi:hypothetical protein